MRTRKKEAGGGKVRGTPAILLELSRRGLRCITLRIVFLNSG